MCLKSQAGGFILRFCFRDKLRNTALLDIDLILERLITSLENGRF